MAVIKRHWWKALLAILVVIAGTILVTTYHPSAKAHADTGDSAQPAAQTPAGQPDRPKIDPALRGRVGSLCEHLCLRPMDLAAIGCDHDAAANVLTAVATWCQTNKSALDATESEHIRATYERERLARLPARTLDLSSNITKADADASAAAKNRQAMMDSLVSAVEAGLSDSQKAAWKTLRTNSRLPRPYCFASSLSDQQA